MNERYSLVVGESILIRYRSTRAACRLHVYEIIYRVNTKTLLDFKQLQNRNLLEYFYKYGTAGTLTQEIFNFPARRQRAVKCKMALTSQQRGWCVLEFHQANSVVTVQRAFKRKFNVDPPTNKSILKWHRNFIERGCICDQRKGHSSRPSVSEQVVDRVRESFLRSPRKSTRRASRELQVPQSTVRYHMKLYEFMQLQPPVV